MPDAPSFSSTGRHDSTTWAGREYSREKQEGNSRSSLADNWLTPLVNNAVASLQARCRLSRIFQSPNICVMFRTGWLVFAMAGAMFAQSGSVEQADDAAIRKLVSRYVE